MGLQVMVAVLSSSTYYASKQARRVASAPFCKAIHRGTVGATKADVVQQVVKWCRMPLPHAHSVKQANRWLAGWCLTVCKHASVAVKFLCYGFWGLLYIPAAEQPPHQQSLRTPSPLGSGCRHPPYLASIWLRLSEPSPLS
jgi:hypothetical protein